LSGNATLYAQWTRSTTRSPSTPRAQFGRFDHRQDTTSVVLPGTSFAGNTLTAGSPRGRRHAGHLALHLERQRHPLRAVDQVNDTLTFNAEGGSSVASITPRTPPRWCCPARASPATPLTAGSPRRSAARWSPRLHLEGNAPSTRVDPGQRHAHLQRRGGSSVASITAQDTTSVVLPARASPATPLTAGSPRRSAARWSPRPTP